MRTLLIIALTCTGLLSYSQNGDTEKEALLATEKANDFVYEGNTLVTSDDYIAAEKAYRKAISERPDHIAGSYNLGNSYYEKGNYDEALFRQQQAAKNASSKEHKHKAYHNIGNILMQGKQCKLAVEAYKNALRNDPTDEETRYNLALAKVCAEQQEDQDKNKDKDKKEEEKDQEEKKDQENQDKENQDQDNKGDQDKKEGEDQKDQGQPEKDKQNPEQGDDNKAQQPQPGQLSPQQIKNLLEAMNNQEQKTQEKINAEKTKGIKVRTEKDW